MNSTCLFLMKVWSDRGSTCKLRNARSAFRNLHVDPLSLHTFMRNKQVEFNPYRPWAAIYPPPPRGILQGYIFLIAYTKYYKMSHVSTLAVGAFRIFGVKREEIMQKSLKIGNILMLTFSWKPILKINICI